MSINKALVTDLRKAQEQVAELEAENKRLEKELADYKMALAEALQEKDDEEV